MKGIKNSPSDLVFDFVVNGFLIIFAILVIYPLYFVVIASFSDPDMVNAGRVFLLPKGLSLLGYNMVFRDNRLWTGYINTFLYTGGYTAVATISTLLAGYSLSRKNLYGRGFFLFIFIFTMYFNGGLIPTYIVMKKIQLVGNPVIMILMNSLIVFYVFIAKTYFETTIPEELIESAKLDGCSNWTFFIKIALPLSQAIVAVILLYYAVIQWNSYFTALIYLNKPNQYPLQIVLRDILVQSQQAVQTSIEVKDDLEKIAGLVKFGVIVVSAVPMLILYPFLQRYFVEGVMIGSVKG